MTTLDRLAICLTAAVTLLGACTGANPDYGRAVAGRDAEVDGRPLSVDGSTAVGGSSAVGGQGGSLSFPHGTGGAVVSPDANGGDDVQSADERLGEPPPTGPTDGPASSGDGTSEAANSDLGVAVADQRPAELPAATDGPVATDTAPAPDAAPADTTPDSSSPDLGPPPVNGLRGDYYAGALFEQFRISRIDQVIDFNWKHEFPDENVPAENFSVRWSGELAPRYSELYTFTFIHDDGVRLWIDDEPLVDRWDRSGSNTTGQKQLVAGQRHRIRVEYCDRALTATIRLSWSSPSQPPEVIPYTRLFTH